MGLVNKPSAPLSIALGTALKRTLRLPILENFAARSLRTTTFSRIGAESKGSGGPPMVSTDHFADELRSQLRAAAAQGATNILITSRELCKSVRSGTAFLDACCEAMQQELRPGDIVVRDKDSGAGMGVRYQLPR